MKKYLPALLLTIGLASCGDRTSTTPNPDLVMSTDFDSLMGWLPENGLSTAQAHSGRYSLTVDPQREFSLNYVTPLSQLSDTRFRGVRLEGWAFVPDKGETARLVVVLRDRESGKDITRDDIVLGEQVRGKYGEWVKISRDIEFPATASADSQLVVYLWRGIATSPNYVDDLQLTLLH